MDTPDHFADPAEFLASLERRHEDVVTEIDQLADRIETILFEFKPPTPTPTAAV
ncbi:MAG: hypothetical protein SGI77_19455 [Pirellulaceae bacterium]|nr:hypothetical protein [Pirellulaceae bacterium]